MKIVLIPCTADKLDHAAPARELYCSENFRKLLRIAELQGADEILILSALHHVVDLETVLDPYDYTLVGRSDTEKKEWARIVISELSNRFNLETDEFIIYTPDDYNYFIDSINKKIFPLKGLSRSRRAQKITEILDGLERGKKLTKSDEIQFELCRRIISMKEEYIDICSGDLHRAIGGYPGKNHCMSTVCSVMRKAMTGDDMILKSPPKGNGATVVIRYFSRNHLGTQYDENSISGSWERLVY